MRLAGRSVIAMSKTVTHGPTNFEGVLASVSQELEITAETPGE
jgi:hypothetical protein